MDRFTDNQFIISTRPNKRIAPYLRFVPLFIQPFTKNQALALIDKISFRQDNQRIKDGFRQELDQRLFRTHREFAENPLLLTIMLMTYEKYEDIPSKMHVFYKKAYEALVQEHDLNKGYNRPLATELSADDFAAYLSEFCALSYCDENFKPTREQVHGYFGMMSIFGRRNDPKMTVANFLEDMTDNLCMMYLEDEKYDFLLRDLASTDPGNASLKLYRQATTQSTLREALNYYVKTPNVTNVLIDDELSEYVDLYTNQPDIVVTKTSLDGTKKNLSISYDGTAKNYKVTDNDTEVGRIVIDGKKISLDFKDDVDYSTADLFTLSFNVESSTKAYQDYASNLKKNGNNGYGEAEGDEKTDYGTNTTSSEKPGFYANKDATLTYSFKSTDKTLPYAKPVIQVGDTSLEIQKAWTKEVPTGVDEVTVNVLQDGTQLTTVTLKKSDGWKTTLEHLVPKQLVEIEKDSDLRDKDGNLLKKLQYVPYVYTLEEVMEPDDETVAEILKKYKASYEFTATETADKSSFTNATSKYEGGKLVYYIPAQGNTAASDKGKAVVTNSILVDIQIYKVDDKNEALDGVVFTLQKKEGAYQNIKAIKKTQDSEELKYSDVTGIDSNSSFTSGTSAITITNLSDGDYKLVEDSTKPGYVILQKEIEFTITDGEIEGTNIEGKVKFEKANGTTLAMITITNEPGVALPNTGGSGTTALYLIGIVLAGFAGAGLLMRRKRRAA